MKETFKNGLGRLKKWDADNKEILKIGGIILISYGSGLLVGSKKRKKDVLSIMDLIKNKNVKEILIHF